MKIFKKKYHTVGIIPTSNNKRRRNRGNFDIPSKHTYTRPSTYLAWLRHFKGGGAKLALWDQDLLSE